MLKEINFIGLLLFLFLNACVEKTNSIRIFEENLPKPKILRGEKFNFTEFVNPIGISMSGKYGVVWEDKSVSDDKFHIIDISTMEYLQSKGIDGLGPGEITTSYLEPSEEENKVWNYDIEARVYSKFDLLDSNKLAEFQIKSPPTTYFLTRTTWAENNTLIGSTADGWTKYLHVTLEGDTLNLLGSWKDMLEEREFPNGIKTDELKPNAISYLFQGPIKGNINNNIYVKVGMVVDYIDIIDLSTKTIKTINGPRQDIQDFSISYNMGYQIPVFPSESTERYIDLYVGEDSFFVLFFGKPYAQISDLENLNRVFEFDFDGKILKQYQLDFPLNGFTVDEAGRYIYGVTVDREPNLVRFEY